MKAEELLKNISSLLKKHENFLNNNPELFYAIEERLLKAVDDDEEDSDYDWTNIGKDEYQDEEDDGSGYGDDLFDKIPSDEDEDEDQRYIRESSGEDDGEEDEASRWLREHGEETGDEDQSGFDYDPGAARESDEGPTPDADEDGDIQQKIPKTEEPKRSSSRMVDWKPQDKYAPEHQKAIEAAMKEGYSHREAERMVGAHKVPSDFYSALRGSTRPSEPSPKMLEQLRGHAHEWLRNAEKKQAESAEAEINPIKHASGKAIAAHDAAHKDFEAAHNEFLQSEELKGLSGRARHQAIQSWKKDWQEKNPEHKEKAIAAADTGKIFGEATKAREERRKEGEQAILGAGKSFGVGTTGEYSQAAAGGDDEPVSGQAAAQMVGTKEDGEDGGFTTNIKTDPAAVFAERNPEYVKHLQSKLNPDQQKRLSGVNAIKIKKGTP